MFKVNKNSNKNVYTYNDLAKTVISQDIEQVSQWLKSKNLNFRFDKLAVKTIKKQIEEMYFSYEEFSEDEERTDKIVEEIENSGKLYPIFIEENDSNYFVMEGRHRMVAMWKMGYRKLPVMFVSENKNET